MVASRFKVSVIMDDGTVKVWLKTIVDKRIIDHQIQPTDRSSEFASAFVVSIKDKKVIILRNLR